MLRIISFLKKHDQAIFAVLFLIGIFFFVRYKIYHTNDNGVITIAKVIRFDGAESGSELYIEVFLNGKSYHTSIGQECQSNCIGNYFFVKVLKDNPTSYIIFFGDKQVPDCILKNVRYFKGWKDIPTGENYKTTM